MVFTKMLSFFLSLFLHIYTAKAGSSERKDFVNEIDMMKTVAKGSNPHVVSLIGCVTVEEPLCLIIDYLKYGDLLNYLHCIKEEVSSAVVAGMSNTWHYLDVIHLFSWC